MKRLPQAANSVSCRRRRTPRGRRLIALFLAVSLVCSFTGSLQRVPLVQEGAALTSINVCDAAGAAAKMTGQAPCLPQAAYTIAAPEREHRCAEQPPGCAGSLVVSGLERPPKISLCSA